MHQNSLTMYHRNITLWRDRVRSRCRHWCRADRYTSLSPRSAGTRFTLQVGFFILWITGISVCVNSLYSYEFSGTTNTQFPATWPADLPLRTTPHSPTLLFFVHPRCPCTAAGIAELDRVLSRAPACYTTYVIFPIPMDAPADWLHGSNYAAALRLPNVEIIEDNLASLTAAFGVIRSGSTLVYGPDGRLIFGGGITASRGHEGTNYGSLALESIARGSRSPQPKRPVFGCPVASATPRLTPVIVQ